MKLTVLLLVAALSLTAQTQKKTATPKPIEAKEGETCTCDAKRPEWPALGDGCFYSLGGAAGERSWTTAGIDRNYYWPSNQSMECKNGMWVRNYAAESQRKRAQDIEDERIARFRRGQPLTARELQAMNPSDLWPRGGGIFHDDGGREYRNLMAKQVAAQAITIAESLQKTDDVATRLMALDALEKLARIVGNMK